MNSLISAVFQKKTNKIELKFSNGVQLCFATNFIGDLQGKNHSDIENMSVVSKGSIIYWPAFDLRVSVVRLCEALIRGESWSHSNSS